MIPMLMPREPAPVIDVSKPALPKRELKTLPLPCAPDFQPVVLDFALTDEQLREFSFDPWSIFEKIPEARKFLPQRTPWPLAIHVAIDPARPGSDKTVAMTYTVDKGVLTVQSIAEREEPADPDGWIPWAGGECPVPNDRVLVKTQDGREEELRVGRLWQWTHDAERSYGDIIAYRVLS